MDPDQDDLPIPAGPDAGPARESVVKACQAIGSLMELWGFKRIHGALWTFLYLHDRSMDAQELREGLGISSGLVSMTLHELIRWGVVSRSQAPGSRRERYRAEPDIWRAVAKVLRERELFWLRLAMDELEQAEKALKRLPLPGDLQHAPERIEELLKLGEIGGDLLEGLLSVGTLDVRRLRQVRLGMGVMKLLERRGKRKPGGHTGEPDRKR